MYKCLRWEEETYLQQPSVANAVKLDTMTWFPSSTIFWIKLFTLAPVNASDTFATSFATEMQQDSIYEFVVLSQE